MAKPPHHSFGPVFGSLRTQLTIGIRREDPTRIWERRAPLTPDTVNYLVSKKNVRVHIESCDRRVFPNREYIKVCILHWSLLILSCPRIRVRPSSGLLSFGSISTAFFFHFILVCYRIVKKLRCLYYLFPQCETFPFIRSYNK
jgi:hypothetical protein